MRLAAGALALVLVYIQPLSAAEAPETAAATPKAIVNTLNTGLLTIMKGGEKLGFAGRLKTITPVVKKTFNMQYLSASTIGKAIWQSWSQDQRSAYVDMFERFLTANYAAQFKAYSGQNFEILGTKPGPRSTTLVETRLNRTNKEPVALTYLTRERAGKTGIIDIFLAGTISEAARRRSEFGSVYQQKGFNGLMTMLEDKVATLSSGAAATASKIFPDIDEATDSRVEL